MENNDQRERNFIIPCIYTLFCLCVTIGGILLVFYVFFPSLSQPWHPIAALILIGSTWLFWLLTYIYSCMKLFFRRDNNRPTTTRQPTRNASVSSSASASAMQKGGGKQDSSVDSGIPLANGA